MTLWTRRTWRPTTSWRLTWQSGSLAFSRWRGGRRWLRWPSRTSCWWFSTFPNSTRPSGTPQETSTKMVRLLPTSVTDDQNSAQQFTMLAAAEFLKGQFIPNKKASAFYLTFHTICQCRLFQAELQSFGGVNHYFFAILIFLVNCPFIIIGITWGVKQ